jgi:hypothetical protein
LLGSQVQPSLLTQIAWPFYLYKKIPTTHKKTDVIFYFAFSFFMDVGFRVPSKYIRKLLSLNYISHTSLLKNLNPFFMGLQTTYIMVKGNIVGHSTSLIIM